MIELLLDYQRIFFTFLIQPIVILFYLIIILKLIIGKSITYIRYIFLGFYVFIALGLIINLIYINFEGPIVYQLHFLTTFFIFFSIIFPLIFDLLLIFPKNYKLLHTFVISICAGSLILILNIPNGIILNESTGWRPIWSLQLLIFLYCYFSIILSITHYLNYQIYKKIHDNWLKKKWKFYFIGFSGMSFYLYFVTLYNTWKNPFFNTFYIFLSIGLILFSYFIYKGIGTNL
ncbi:MAG: hypothetical protein ACTSVV_15350 [Promethearchaeota archaeon]